MDNTIERYYLAETAKMREIWSDAASPYEERIAALVALCEEVIDDLSLLDERAFTKGYRERLEKLKGAG